MKFVTNRAFADPHAPARKLVELANGIKPVQDGRLYRARQRAVPCAGGSGEEFRAGIECAVALGWLWRHESGTYLKFTEAGAAMFA
jgi:hypothetical protein